MDIEYQFGSLEWGIEILGNRSQTIKNSNKGERGCIHDVCFLLFK